MRRHRLPLRSRGNPKTGTSWEFPDFLEVGYQSLSHFAKAFREETGNSPSKWLGRKCA